MKTIDFPRILATALQRLTVSKTHVRSGFRLATPCANRFAAPTALGMAVCMLLPILLCPDASAQKAAKAAWHAKLDHYMTDIGLSPDGSFCYGSNPTEFSLVNSGNGKVLWNRKFQEIDKRFSKIDDEIPLWEENVLLVIVRKNRNDLMGCVDLATGNLLWSTEKYQNIHGGNIVHVPGTDSFACVTRDGISMVRTRTGEQIWNTTDIKGDPGTYAFMPDGFLLLLLYNSSATGSSGSGIGNRVVKIHPATGNVAWVSTCTGSLRFKLVTGEALVDMEMRDGKLLLCMDGIQVFDYMTGATSWSAPCESVFDEHLKVLRPPANAIQYAWYGAIAKPLVDGNDVYVIDTQDRKTQHIRKYDLASGRLLWTSPEFENATAIPVMFLAGNTIVLQTGGFIECQYREFIEEHYSGSYGGYWDVICDRWLSRYFMIDPSSLVALDTGNGSLVWQSDLFHDGITNAMLCDDRIIVANQSTLYSIDPATGMNTSAVKLKADGIGLATSLIDYKDMVLVVGERGASRHRKINLELLDSSRWKATSYRNRRGGTLMFQTGNTGVITYDAETGISRSYKPRAGCEAQLSADGRFLYAWEKNTITRTCAR